MLQPQITTAAHDTATPTPAARLEQARRRVRVALNAADEGEPSFDTLEAISRALVAANSDLEAVAVDFDTRPRSEVAR